MTTTNDKVNEMKTFNVLAWVSFPKYSVLINHMNVETPILGKFGSRNVVKIVKVTESVSPTYEEVSLNGTCSVE